MKNRTIGSIFIVAGTTIGAGMLAMPLATAGVGFGTTALLLFFLWAIMCYTSLLMIEVYQHSTENTGLDTLAKLYLGRKGQWLAGSCMLFLMYALTAAYISGAGELLAQGISQWLEISFVPSWGVLLFTLVTGSIVGIGTHSVDFINRILFSIKIIVFTLMLVFLAPHIHQINLLSLPLEQGLVLSAIPIVFTSFGFHGSIPSVICYMEGNITKLRRVFIIGSAIPLITYLCWQLVTLGSINSNIFVALLAQEAGLTGLVQAVKEIVITPHVELALQLFADLALATSLLGVSLGLFDYLADLFKRSNTRHGRLQTSLLTFIPPLIFALFYPKGFIVALGFAAIALAVLALLLPTLLVWQVRKKQQPGQVYRVIGSTYALVLIFCFGLTIIAIQFCTIFGLLPAVG